MMQPRRNLDLAKKTLRTHTQGELGLQHLYRNAPMVLGILGEIHRRHAARTELTLDAVTAG